MTRRSVLWFRPFSKKRRALDYRDHYPAVLRWLSHLVDLCLACLAALPSSRWCSAMPRLRGFAGFDLAWSLEVTSFLLLWSTFLGCSAAIARGAHMRVTEVVEKLVPLTRTADAVDRHRRHHRDSADQPDLHRLQHLGAHLGAEDDGALLAGRTALRLHAGRHVRVADLPSLQHGVSTSRTRSFPMPPIPTAARPCS